MGQKQGPAGSVIDQNVNASGAYRANAHPVSEDETPFDKLTQAATRVGTFVEGVLGRMNSTGSHRSPSTIKDKGH